MRVREFIHFSLKEEKRGNGVGGARRNAFLPAGIKSLFCLLKDTYQGMVREKAGPTLSPSFLPSISTSSFSKYHKDEEVLPQLCTSRGQGYLVSAARCRS